jgi:hypothetical protein
MSQLLIRDIYNNNKYKYVNKTTKAKAYSAVLMCGVEQKRSKICFITIFRIFNLNVCNYINY